MPAPGTEWPPPAHQRHYVDHRVNSAWYSGDPQQLGDVYGMPGGYPGGPFFAVQNGRPAQHAGGVVGRVARWFWGAPPVEGQRPAKLHVPMGADLAATSANVLLAQRPAFILDDNQETAQKRLDGLFDERAMMVLHEAAEACAALGGVYLRGTWDLDLEPTKPFVTAVHADAAIPTWRWGRLVAVTFHREIYRDGSTVWRHLEHHAVENGAGYIEHALYVGTDQQIGRPTALAEHPDTAGLLNPDADSLTPEGLIPTGLDRLDVVHWSNGIDRRRRCDPIAHPAGRSDFAGVEPLMDALDECYTSWMRDVRLGKARLFVAAGHMQNLGPGKGAVFNDDQELFTEVNALLEGQSGLGIQAEQFAIRFAEHGATALALANEIVGKAGYSAQTFGLTGEVAMTATESDARERKTLWTRAGKWRPARLALADLSEILLGLDVHHFRGKVAPIRPDLELPPLVAESARERAETVSLISAAGAASDEVLVAMLHPDWDDKQVQAEVDKLAEKREAEMPPPPDEFGRPPKGDEGEGAG